MDELAARVADEFGYPADLVERAAAARAQASGTTTEGLLQQWAGGEAAAPAPVATAEAPPAVEPAAAEPEIIEDAGPQVEVLEPVAAEEPVTEAAVGHADEDEDEEAASSVLAGFPSWLAAAFIVIPILALTYAALAPDGPACGVSGQLALDPVTGEAVNCDGTPYGVEIVNFFAVGEQLYAQRCSSCHGADGGGGAGPALAGGAVLATFPGGQCESHVAWVSLGSTGWPDPTYGVLGKPVGGFGAAMPGFGDILTQEDIAAISLYERVFFGAQPLPEGLDDCGLNEPGEITAAP